MEHIKEIYQDNIFLMNGAQNCERRCTSWSGWITNEERKNHSHGYLFYSHVICIVEKWENRLKALTFLHRLLVDDKI